MNVLQRQLISNCHQSGEFTTKQIPRVKQSVFLWLFSFHYRLLLEQMQYDVFFLGIPVESESVSAISASA